MLSNKNMNYFTKENLDIYLKELAKEYRRLIGKKMQAEIILVGGAAIIANYGFRDITTDMDAIIHAPSSMKDAINHVGDKFGLPNGWLNADFMRTASYSSKLSEYSGYYRTFSNILTVRTVEAEYLIAMKLCSCRPYKNDMSDIIGILVEHAEHGTPITMDKIKAAVENLYGNWDKISDASKTFIDNVMKSGDYSKIYEEAVESEKKSKDMLISYENDNPGIVSEGNANEIISMLKEKQSYYPS